MFCTHGDLSEATRLLIDECQRNYPRATENLGHFEAMSFW
jgi:hypothetical protein